MSIKRKSWHYQLATRELGLDAKRYWERKHQSFCAYWWAIVWRIVVLAAAFLGLALVVLALAVAVWQFPVQVMTVVVLLTTGFGVPILIAWLLDRKPVPQPEREPGLVSQWYSARKQRICPRVEFED